MRMRNSKYLSGYKIGVAADLWQMFDVGLGEDQTAMLAIEGVDPQDRPEYVNFGLEYGLMKMLALRLGGPLHNPRMVSVVSAPVPVSSWIRALLWEMLMFPTVTMEVYWVPCCVSACPVHFKSHLTQIKKPVFCLCAGNGFFFTHPLCLPPYKYFPEREI